MRCEKKLINQRATHLHINVLLAGKSETHTKWGKEGKEDEKCCFSVKQREWKEFFFLFQLRPRQSGIVTAISCHNTSLNCWKIFPPALIAIIIPGLQFLSRVSRRNLERWERLARCEAEVQSARLDTPRLIQRSIVRATYGCQGQRCVTNS